MTRRHIVVFSGGSAANNLVDVFGKVAEDKSCDLSYIIPISDNGGSSSELIRVFGGPGIGDVRTERLYLATAHAALVGSSSILSLTKSGRLVRLIPSKTSPESTSIKALFNHRLSSSPANARVEWLDIVEARHPLWTNITSSKRELIRSFFNTINLEIVKRARPSSVFNFQSASVGNLFLTGARLFTGSFESAIYLLGSITGVPGKVHVIPAINSNFSHHISAGLEDGTIITGQNAISHPSAPSAETTTNPLSLAASSHAAQVAEDNLPESPMTLTRRFSRELSAHDLVEDANLPGSLPSLRKQYIDFAKEHTADLPSRIERIWYINPYGQEIRPAPNTAALEAIRDSSCVIYSIGSLYTSIIPCLVLRDVGRAIAAGTIRSKILILNGSLDRETRSEKGGFGARDFVKAIVDACDSSRGERGEWREYVTHVIHLQGDGTPRVEKEELAEKGIECVRIYGRRHEGEVGMVYDGIALTQALEAILGRRDHRGEKLRRNTVENYGVRSMIDD